MSPLHVVCKTGTMRLCVSGASDPGSWRLRTADGTDLPLTVAGGDGGFTVLDASALIPWSPDHPHLYTLETPQGSCRFGYCDLDTDGNRAVLLNGKPLFLRGVIRGIVAHDHPNMTGLPKKAAYEKYIRQAKKYGFNLVRFHSTIPDESFVEAADELGFLIHLEIGFSYQYDDEGNKKRLKIDRELWRQTILRYRNHPSLAIFCLGNEMHQSGKNPDVRALIAEGRMLAPSKLFLDNSGWGEYDRDTADVYAQHFAYYLPYKHHAAMFESDECWRYDDSAFDDVSVDETVKTPQGSAAIHREMVNQRPVFAHEAMHYIEMVDYEELNRRFDEFCAAAGPEYLAEHDIRKPRYLTELPALIRQKKLGSKMPDYIRGSQVFKQMAMKIYLERLRFSRLCGFEMLQFADCLKYENKNGIVDCFDDDKSIDAAWFRCFNADAVLLAEFDKETFYRDEPVEMRFYLSDFLDEPRITGTLTIKLNGEIFWRGEHVSATGGLQKLVTLQCRFAPKDVAGKVAVSAEFSAEKIRITNSWHIWLYPRPEVRTRPLQDLSDAAMVQYLQAATVPDSETYLTDRLDDAVLENLSSGKRVVLLYHRNAPGNRYLLPGARERFKPCIWDRGNNLGGFITSEFLSRSLGSDRYFEANMQPLLEGNCKISLDRFPFPVREIVCGIDKPVRDRMRGLIYGVKGFIPEDTLRNFSHLFSVGIGEGILTVCTLFPPKFKADEPVAANLLAALLDHPEEFTATEHIEADEFKSFLDRVTAEGERPEDVMNLFWELDNKPVEDTLFWEEARVDLSKLK